MQKGEQTTTDARHTTRDDEESDHEDDHDHEHNCDHCHDHDRDHILNENHDHEDAGDETLLRASSPFPPWPSQPSPLLGSL